MGMFFSSLWNRLFAFKEFKICIVGLDNAGKTTVLYQLHLGEVVDTQPTIGSNVESVIHRNIHFTAWDLSGQSTLRSSWSTYYTGTHAVIVVVDSTDTARMATLKNELWTLLAHDALRSAVLLVFANKQDCAKKLTSGQIAEQLELSKIKTHAWHIQACSALTGDGLYQGMEWITEKVTGTKAPLTAAAPPSTTATSGGASAATATAAAPATASPSNSSVAKSDIDVKTPPAAQRTKK